MFFKKMVLGAVGGGILGVIAMVYSLFDGKSFGDSAGMIPGCIIVGMMFVWWATKDDPGEYETAGDRQAFQLQERLRSAVQSAIYAEERGDHATAAHFRGEAAALESRLRNLGA